MKNRILVLFVFLVLCIALGADQVRLSGDDTSVTVLSSDDNQTVLWYKVGVFDSQRITINGETWHSIGLAGEGVSQEKGKPQLPVLNRSIIVSNRANLQLEVFDLEYQELEMRVVPSKGVITRDQDPSLIPYTFSEVYASDGFYPSQPVTLSDPYILRDFRAVTVLTNPFSYNPIKGILRVYTSYKVRIMAGEEDGINTLASDRSSLSRAFLPIYENHFINWQNYRYVPVSDSFGKLLVISHSSFMTQILPWVNWKKQKGIETELVNWTSIGTTAAQLQTYIQNRYNSDSELTYVQLVGDAPQIPSLSSGGGGSDPSFSLVAGSDNYPDIFIGRFSAETVGELNTQINRSIAYERDLAVSDTWLSRGMGIASNEGGGSMGDNGESDIAHMNIIRGKLLNYGYTTVDQVYDPGATAATVSTNVNAGRGFINYVGHGSNTSWSTTGFSNTNALNLTNGAKTPFIMDVACVNGNFVSITCFAEAWMRSSGGGAVSIYASTINQSWNSPMRAQDEFTDLLVAESKTTTGGLYYNSSCKMMDVYGNTTGSDGVNMFRTWHIFGDASLVIRSKTPQIMNVSHPASILSGAGQVSVATGVANALVAVTHNNTIYGSGYTNSSGTVSLNLNNPPIGALDYTITVTAFNRVSYIGTISQIVGSGPYLSVTNVEYNDSNDNLANYNETGRFHLGIQNIGSEASENVTAQLSTTSQYISIINPIASSTALAVGQTVSLPNAFSFEISNAVPSGTVADFSISLSSGGEDWVHDFSLEIAAPQLVFGALTINDALGNGNGRLDPGETVNVIINLQNSGSYRSPSGSAVLSSSTTGITVPAANSHFGAIEAGSSANLSFYVQAATWVEQGSSALLTFIATALAYSAQTSQSIGVGAPPEAIIGSGTLGTSTTEGSPINIWYKSLHGQSVYTVSELNAAGVYGPVAITALGFDVVTSPLYSLPNFKIRMKHTSVTNVASWISATDLQTVYQSASYMPQAGSWNVLAFDSPFQWNGVDNIVVDTGFGLVSAYNQSGTVRYSAVSNGYRYVRSDNSDQSGVFTGGTVSSYRPNIKLLFTTPPPPPDPYPVSPRFVAEWEEAQGAIIRYPFGLPYTLIRDLAADDLLWVIVSSANQSTCNSLLSSNGVNMSNVRYVNAASDSYWVRDYSAWFVMDEENSLKVIDFSYNRPRPNDNAIPSVLATHFDLDLHALPLQHTGGNIMTDGKGKAMSTDLVFTENSSLSEAQVRQHALDYLGVTDYRLYPDPNNTYIDHIDCWAKLLDVDKVVIRSVPSTHAQYNAIEAVVAQWQASSSAYGTPYRIYRVYTPNNEPYSNAFILNKKIFVPQMGTANDSAALAVYREAMPAYTVTGYAYSSFESTDAIHCRVNSIFDEDLIYVDHQPISEWISHSSIDLSAAISNNNALLADSTYVAYKTGINGAWQLQILSLSGGRTYSVSLPQLAFGDTLYYAFNAQDVMGRKTQVPLNGRLDPFVLVVNQLGGLDVPQLSIQKLGGSYHLFWDAVNGASSYKIYASDSPSGPFAHIASSSQNRWSITDTLETARFFRVVASSDAP